MALSNNLKLGITTVYNQVQIPSTAENIRLWFQFYGSELYQGSQQESRPPLTFSTLTLYLRNVPCPTLGNNSRFFYPPRVMFYFRSVMMSRGMTWTFSAYQSTMLLTWRRSTSHMDSFWTGGLATCLVEQLCQNV